MLATDGNPIHIWLLNVDEKRTSRIWILLTIIGVLNLLALVTVACYLRSAHQNHTTTERVPDVNIHTTSFIVDGDVLRHAVARNNETDGASL